MRLIHRTLALLSVVMLLAACGEQGETTTLPAEQPPATEVVDDTPDQPEQPPVHPSAELADWERDYHSHANFREISIRHSDIDLEVDFNARSLRGHVVHHLDIHNADAEQLVLDSRNIDLGKISTRAGDDSDWQTVQAQIDDADAADWMGSAVRIPLTDNANQVRIEFATRPEASGLQWLAAELTAGGEHPYLYSQSQAIHARSWIPLQDTPSVRFTYDATLRVPPELMALMSAENPTELNPEGVYQFHMPQPIPSYLMAIAVGNLRYEPMSERTAVYSEPELIDAAKAEFEDTEQMIVIGEALYGPYRWEDYDLLILPPSFPFGGMENPRLSYITPTVIAGDKSLVALIAHELAHSWSGNLVNNATWRDFWLNEGFTRYFENRIMEELFGTERAEMEATLGYQGLLSTMERLDERDEILAVDLRGRDPDDGFHAVPYDKGRLFLAYLEEHYGRETFDAFLREYFDHFAFQSITTETFVDYLQANLLDAFPGVVSRKKVNQWIYEPGIPDDAVIPQSDTLSRLDHYINGIAEGELEVAAIDTGEWSVQEWLYFLDNLPRQLDHALMQEMDQAWQLTESRNNEIAHSWLMLAILNEYEAVYDRLNQYLRNIGRNKLVRPLYQALANGSEQQQAMAREAFADARTGYHPITINAIEALL